VQFYPAICALRSSPNFDQGTVRWKCRKTQCNVATQNRTRKWPLKSFVNLSFLLAFAFFNSRWLLKGLMTFTYCRLPSYRVDFFFAFCLLSPGKGWGCFWINFNFLWKSIWLYNLECYITLCYQSLVRGKYSSLLGSFLSYKDSISFFCKLQMGPISLSVTLRWARKSC
jgi:hypothetical protein